jgi:hypothetical protein
MAHQAPASTSGDNWNHRRCVAELVPQLPGVGSIPRRYQARSIKPQQCQSTFSRYATSSAPPSAPRSSSLNCWRVGGCQCRSPLPDSPRRCRSSAVGNATGGEAAVRPSDIFQDFPEAGRSASVNCTSSWPGSERSSRLEVAYLVQRLRSAAHVTRQKSEPHEARPARDAVPIVSVRTGCGTCSHAMSARGAGRSRSRWDMRCRPRTAGGRNRRCRVLWPLLVPMPGTVCPDSASRG